MRKSRKSLLLVDGGIRTDWPKNSWSVDDAIFVKELEVISPFDHLQQVNQKCPLKLSLITQAGSR